ncbi:MAG: UbiA family prenyltransferase [Actinomycetota bacterium]|nr:UbiA family prenyltransferase [Actinomycetota bacterium]
MRGIPRIARSLLRASHPVPAVAVTVLAMLLAVGQYDDVGMVALLTAAAFTGQLTIGWSNDLVDAERDRQVGRRDKPLATGELTFGLLATALAVVLVCCVVLSLWLGLLAGLAHLGLLVASGWAYNLGLKKTWWSWAPYAVAFGSLPAVVTLALDPPRLPPVWMSAAAAMLGVGAHLVNALPDFTEDTATGITGFPHRLGRAAAQRVATALFVVASLLAVLGPPGPPAAWVWLLLALVVLIAAAGQSGRRPFLAAIAIALIDATMLLVQGAG